MNKISVKEILVTARDLRVTTRQQNFCDPSVQLGTSSIIPVMEYHFVKDSGNRETLSGF